MTSAPRPVRPRAPGFLPALLALLTLLAPLPAAARGRRAPSGDADAAALRTWVREQGLRAGRPGAASPGSLWSDASVAPGADFKARLVNDVVFIQVVETTKASARAQTSSERTASHGSGIQTLLGDTFSPLKDILQGGSQSSFDGTGTTTRSTSLTTSIAARVTEVLPNGTLLVEARRAVRVNGETQRVSLIGLVRPNDLDERGLVLSTQVAELQVVVEGKGVVSEVNRPGWLQRLLHALLPV